jgi:hypothetical protein
MVMKRKVVFGFDTVGVRLRIDESWFFWTAAR